MTEIQPLSEDRRREIFLALVEAQDAGTAVAQSREAMAVRFGVPEQTVKEVEREGLDSGWPPLSDS
jgi:hypothetical protein